MDRCEILQEQTLLLAKFHSRGEILENSKLTERNTDILRFLPTCW